MIEAQIRLARIAALQELPGSQTQCIEMRRQLAEDGLREAPRIERRTLADGRRPRALRDRGHAAIARVMGPYKLSLHSGSDKFSIYPIAVRHAKDLVHLKTAGTSYLEALRALAIVAPDLLRQILTLAHERYEEDKRTYHVSADPSRVPSSEDLEDKQLPGLLDMYDARQMLHVTYGSALDRYGARLVAILDSHEEEYYSALEKHFIRHVSPLASSD